MSAWADSLFEMDFSRYTILIIDDNPLNLGVIFDYLKSYGFKIMAARDGESGLKRAEYVRPDIILLDVMMPGLDGFETCRRLKASPTTGGIPVIFMTALASTEDKVKGFQAGAVDYVTKPLQQEEVLARVTTHLRIRNLTSELQAANAALSKRAAQLETSSQVGRQVTSILDLEPLFDQVVQLIQARFGYYMVSIWTVDDRRESAVLRACQGARQPAPCQRGMRIPMQAASIITRVCQSGQAYLSEDVRQDAHYLPLHEWPEARSELALPLRVGEWVMGALDILGDQAAAFEADDQMVMQTLADQVAVAVRNAQLYKAEQYRRRAAESLEQTGRALSSSLDLGHMPERILEQLAAVVPYARGSFMLRQANVTRLAAQRGFPLDDRLEGLEVPIQPGDVFDQIAQTRQPLVVNDVTQEPGWHQTASLPLHKSWLGVPLISQDRVIGMISLTRLEAGAFSRDDANLVSVYAAQASIALENARLYDEIRRFNEQLELMVQERTQELDRAYRTLEKLDRTKSDFIEIAAHELRTPLTLIKGYTQLLEPLTENMAEIRPLVEGILVGQNRLYEIVNSLLDVSRITCQALELVKEPVCIAEVVESVRAAFEASLQERRLTLTLAGLDELPALYADLALLRKLFYHLIVNAIKYTPNGGSITVRGQVVSTAEGSLVEVIVSDTGIGIDPDHQELIFEKFYQMGEISFHSSGKTKFKGGGPGLGLSIAKGIALAHGGKIWVESPGYDEQLCPGSHFHVCLPLEEAS